MTAFALPAALKSVSRAPKDSVSSAVLASQCIYGVSDARATAAIVSRVTACAALAVLRCSRRSRSRKMYRPPHLTIHAVMQLAREITGEQAPLAAPRRSIAGHRV